MISAIILIVLTLAFVAGVVLVMGNSGVDASDRLGTLGFRLIVGSLLIAMLWLIGACVAGIKLSL